MQGILGHHQAVCGAVQGGGVDLTADLVGHWAGNNTEVGGEWSDLTGNGHHATTYDEASITANGLLCVGTGDYADAGNAVAVAAAQGTMAVWTYINNTAEHAYCIYHRTERDDNRISIVWTKDGIGMKPQCAWGNLASGVCDDHTTVVPLEQWHHAAMTWETEGDSSITIRLYVDGILEDTDTGLFGITVGGLLSLGAAAVGPTLYNILRGYTDDIRIYDAIKTQAFIQSIISDSAYTHDS